MKVTQDEVTVPMTDEQALEYLCWCRTAWKQGLLTSEMLGLAPRSKIEIRLISKPGWKVDAYLPGKKLFCIALAQAAAAEEELVLTISRRIQSRFVGIDIPVGLPRPRMILLEV